MPPSWDIAHDADQQPENDRVNQTLRVLPVVNRAHAGSRSPESAQAPDERAGPARLAAQGAVYGESRERGVKAVRRSVSSGAA